MSMSPTQCDGRCREVAERIRNQRMACGLSLRQAGQCTGVSFTHLSHIEGCRKCPTISMLYRIADGLGVSARELLPP